MMVKTILRSSLLVGWGAIAAVTVVVSLEMHAAISTTLLLSALGIAPAILTMMLSDALPSPTVAEILHSVDLDE